MMSGWADAMWHALCFGSAAVLLAWAVCRWAPVLPADARCWLWRLALLKLLVAFCWTTPLPLPVLTGETVAAPSSAGAASAPPSRPARLAAAAPPAATPPSPSPTSALVPFLFLVWAGGVAATGAAAAARYRRLLRLRRTCEPVLDPELLRLRSELCRALGLTDEPALSACEGVNRPLLAGIRRPEVILPKRLLRECGPADIRFAVAHELCHLRRRDLAWAGLTLAVRGLFFFHPLVWLADRESRFAQELACDELTVRITQGSAAEYGRLLLRVSTSDRAAQPALLPSIGIADSYVTLRRRLSALHSLRRPSRRYRAAAAGGLGALALIGVVPWRAVAGREVTYLDLSPAANLGLEASFGTGEHAGNDLSTLPRGSQVLGGYRFYVGDRCIQLAGEKLSEHPARVRIPVGRRFSTLAVLQATAWGGAAPGKADHVPDGTRVGDYRIHYADGNSVVLPLLYGEDLRDWWASGEAPPQRAVLAWTGRNRAERAAGQQGIRLFARAWQNPHPQRMVSHVEFASAGKVPAPFCVAITCGE